MSGSRPEYDEARRLRREAQAAIDGYKSFLASPAFQHSIDVAVLVKIAGDETADIRERRRAAEVLAKLRLQAMEGLAALIGAREQSLDVLGIKSTGAGVSLTQINQKIEIVRATDWRSAAPLGGGSPVEVEALSPGEAPESNGHDVSEQAKPEEANGADPAA